MASFVNYTFTVPIIWLFGLIVVYYSMITIYKITNPNNKVYIGQTKNVERRLAEYRRLRCKTQVLLYNSLFKYGFNNHIIEVLDIVPEELADEMEIHYIDIYKTYSKLYPNGLNIAIGGSRPPTMKGSDHYKAKEVYQYNLDGTFLKKWNCIRELCKQNGYNTSRICSAAKNGTSSYSYLWSYTLKDMIYISLNSGKPSKAVLQYSLEGEFVNRYKSISEASNKTGINRRTIMKHLLNKPIQRIRCKFKWTYDTN
jgi:group I intron endonuclease